MEPVRRPEKTYAHLARLGRMPTEYEVVSSALLYHVGKGFEVATPVTAFHEAHRSEDGLGRVDGERFDDPRATTYTGYVSLQSKQECYVDGLLAAMEASPATRSADWLARLRLFVALRHPMHGLQMLAAYVGAMAPGGKIAIAAAMQAADELRRVQRVAYLVALLEAQHRGFADDARARFMHDDALQPLRRTIETLLVTYDFGEALVGLCLCLKPVFDTLVLERFADAARREGDPLLAEVLASLAHDARWHGTWSRAFVRGATNADPALRAVVADHARVWAPRALAAARALAGALLGHADDATYVSLERAQHDALIGAGVEIAIDARRGASP